VARTPSRSPPSLRNRASEAPRAVIPRFVSRNPFLARHTARKKAANDPLIFTITTCHHGIWEGEKMDAVREMDAVRRINVAREIHTEREIYAEKL